MNDFLVQLAQIYGVSRRELTVGQIEDFFIEKMKINLGLDGQKGETFRKGFNPNTLYISNTDSLISEEKNKGIRVSGEKGKGKGTTSNEKFVKPTVEEIKAYCAERKNGIDAEAFFYFYESKGWLIGRNPMKSWKAAIRTWEQSRKNTPTTKPKHKGFGNFEERDTDYDALFGGR